MTERVTSGLAGPETIYGLASEKRRLPDRLHLRDIAPVLDPTRWNPFEQNFSGLSFYMVPYLDLPCLARRRCP